MIRKKTTAKHVSTFNRSFADLGQTQILILNGSFLASLNSGEMVGLSGRSRWACKSEKVKERKEETLRNHACSVLTTFDLGMQLEERPRQDFGLRVFRSNQWQIPLFPGSAMASPNLHIFWWDPDYLMFHTRCHLLFQGVIPRFPTAP